MNIPRAYFLAVTALGLAAGVHSDAVAQNGRPQPQEPESHLETGAANATTETQPVIPQTPPNGNGNGNGMAVRRPVAEGKVTLAFNDVPVDEKITAFIAESTGKVVMPVGLATLKSKKITLMNDEPIERALALDLLLTALRLNGVGIIETDQVVVLDLIENIRTKSELSVMGPDDSVANSTNTGRYVIKIFRLKEAPAETLRDHLQENVPDNASLIADVNSNQLILYGDIGLAQQYQQMIEHLDRAWVKVTTETYRLHYADATAVSNQIYDLFDDSGGQQTQPGQPRQPNQPRGRGNNNQPTQPGAATPAGLTQPGVQVQLRVSVNVQHNSVTVSAEPKKVEAIGKLVREQWDLPLPPENAKVYRLKYSDPVKVRDLVQNLLGAGGGSSGTTGGGRAAAPRGIQQNQFNQGGQGGSVADVIGDIYRIEAYPDQNAVIVVSKTKHSLEYLDAVIDAIDQKSDIGLPKVIELKHANAFSLADELNILLAESGTGSGLEKPGAGLTGADNLSSLAEDTGGGGAAAGGETGSEDQGTIEFPWQNAQPREDVSDPSSLIGKVRIVPIERQNALAVLAPVAQLGAVEDLIREFDRPGRQVMISAVIASVELTDDLALGLRFSSQELVPSNIDNSIGGSAGFEGSNEDVFGGLFDTSVLNVNADLNVLLEALRGKTNVRILQEPRVFTADNQEAIFFNGQDVPFINSNNTSDVAGFQQNFDYKAVGVQLDVRPRITAQKDVDMEINLVLSSIVPGQTLFGGFILDRKETKTKIIVKNNQTIVISGILSDTESQITRGIPLLEDIPIFGELFRSRTNSKKTSELVAFITPTVVDTPEENDHNFNEAARERLRNLSMPLKEQAKHREAIRDRIIAPKGENEPILPTAETELDRLRREKQQEQRLRDFEEKAEAIKEGTDTTPPPPPPEDSPDAEPEGGDMEPRLP